MNDRWQRAVLDAMRVPGMGKMGLHKLGLDKLGLDKLAANKLGLDRLAKIGLAKDGLAKAAPAIQKLLAEVLPRQWPSPGSSGQGAGTGTGTAGDIEAGGKFLSLSTSDATGEHRYKLFVPDLLPPAPALLVMLHGCTQSPDDFARGTRMNRLAAAAGCLVAYPEQTSAANAQRCWNWFRAGDQQRDAGEPAIVAGIVAAVTQAHGVDPNRVYAAGLSAGGAAAAVLAEAYPDLFAAVGVHSGLACGAAHDVSSAFMAMRQGHAGSAGSGAAPCVPAIVFHGDRDSTVNPANADAVIAQRSGTRSAGLRAETDAGKVADGHAWSRTRYRDGGQRTVLEQWVVHGAGHAWSGGSPDGSYTDPHGPDASREMLRFFLENPRKG